MNIIIVDDEFTILSILEKSIDWKSLGVDEVFTARNTVEAKSMFVHKQIDIALCDIEMPRESGLSLISWINNMYPATVNIILTGHQDFNYARSAVSLGVFAYLLKPILFSEVEETIRNAVDLVNQNHADGTSQNQEENFDFSRQIALKGFCKDIHEYICAHYNEEITRANIESLVHLNTDHVNREFKKQTGLSLMEYIQLYRIYQAKRLLKETSLSITEVAGKCGYNTQSYFGEVFRKCTGVSPNEYRKMA